MSDKRQKTREHSTYMNPLKNVIKSADSKTLFSQSLMPVNLVKEKSLDITGGREMF